jgi:photosystem II stability/assembly factor-like uncharacterized protein
MKVVIKSILIILILSNISISQTGWIRQNGNTDKILEDVFFVNANTGWIVTDSTQIMKTTDSGLTWVRQTLPFYTPLLAVFFINENTGWAGGGYHFFVHSGYLYKTTNGGINWTANNSGEIHGIYFIDENTGFLGLNASGDFGSGGSLIRTTNGGANWDGIYSSHEFSKISFKNAQTGYAIGHYWDDTSNDTSFIYRTTNAGESWEIKFKERNEQFYYGSLKDISASGNYVWAVGKDSTVIYSSDNGENWSVQNASVKGNLYSVCFIDENTGWAVGNRYPDTTNVMKTINGGANWFNQKNELGNALKSVMFVNENTGWAVGYNGTILKTTTGGLTYVRFNTEHTPTTYTLYQNYPNPFNPTTNLQFGISELGFVTLKVYDIKGNEVTRLLNENKPAGNYEFTFDGSELASGIYFYSLYINNKNVETRKMLLIR